jgi:hypothetical protein
MVEPTIKARLELVTSGGAGGGAIGTSSKSSENPAEERLFKLEQFKANKLQSALFPSIVNSLGGIITGLVGLPIAIGTALGGLFQFTPGAQSTKKWFDESIKKEEEDKKKQIEADQKQLDAENEIIKALWDSVDGQSEHDKALMKSKEAHEFAALVIQKGGGDIAKGAKLVKEETVKNAGYFMLVIDPILKAANAIDSFAQKLLNFNPKVSSTRENYGGWQGYNPQNKEQGIFTGFVMPQPTINPWTGKPINLKPSSGQSNWILGGS